VGVDPHERSPVFGLDATQANPLARPEGAHAPNLSKLSIDVSKGFYAA
jgi:hypothetical protein